VEPQPSLAWTFESSNVDIVTGLAPSSQVSPGPAQLVGSAALVTNAPTSNTAVYFPNSVNSYMNLGTSTPVNFSYATSNLFLEAWIYIPTLQGANMIALHNTVPSRGREYWGMYADALGFLNVLLWGVNGGVDQAFGNNKSSISAQTWTHVSFSVSYDSVNTNYKLSVGINGTVSTATSPTGWTANTFYATGSTSIGGGGIYTTNQYIRDLRVVQGGVVPTTSFTPGSAPFSYTLPSYVTGSGSVVFTLLGQFVTYVPGKYNQALYLNNTPGSTSPNCSVVYSLSSLPFTDTSPGSTVSLWLNPDNVTASVFQVALGMIVSSTFFNIYVNSGNKISFFAQGFTGGSTSGGNINIQYSPSLVAGTWYHVSVVMLSGSITFYVNGASIGSGTFTNSTNFTSMSLGKHSSNGQNAFEGKLDDLRIYNTALTAAQVQSVYSSQGAPAPSRAMPLPQLAWDFNGTTTDYVKGVSGSVGGVVTYENGKNGTALNIKNPSGTTSNSVNFNFSASYSIDLGFSECFWFKCNDLSYLTSIQIVSIAYSGFNNAFRFQINTGGSLQFQFQDSVGNKNINMFGPTVGIWYHLAAVAFNGIVAIYVNGAYYAQMEYIQSGITFNNISIGLATNFAGYPLTNGSYDDLRIFDRALTRAQVQSIYNQQGVQGRGEMTINSYIANGLVAYYDTQNLRYPNSVSGTTWYDISGNGRSVTIRSGSSYNSADKYITFDGTANSGTTVAQTGQTLTQWTVMCAFMQTANGRAFARIAGASPNIDAGEIAVYGQTLAINPPESGSWTYTSFTTTYNVWYHMCIAFDTTTTGVVDAWVYINGALVNSYTIDGTVESLTGYVIGNRTDLNGEAMIGRMSLFAIYNRVLSQSEVSANYEFYKKTQIPTYLPTTSLTGTPLFTQLSASATSSAVGAFSLRAVNGSTAKAVQVIRGAIGTFPPISMTSDNFTATGTYNGIVNGVYVSSASTYYTGSGTEQPYRLFDKNNNGTWWTTSSGSYSTSTGLYTAAVYSTTISGSAYAGEWIQIQLPASVTLSSYTIYNAASWTSRAPVDFKIAGSNDGTTWTLVDTQTAITSWLSSTTSLTFTPSNPSTYSYYRLCVNKYGGGNAGYLSIGELILNGYNSSNQTGSATDFYADRRGNLLTAPVTGQSLANWLGGATGYVTTWYDQSGAGQHMAQTTASLQPVISLATSPPSILFTGNGTTSGQYFQNTIPFTFNFGTNYQYTVRAVVNNTVGGVLVYKGKQGAPWNGNGEKAWYLGPSSLTSTSGNYPDLVGFAEGWVITSTPITSSKTSVTWASSSFSSVAVYENASSVAPSYTRASQLSDASNYLYFGITTASGVPYYNGNIYEIEIFSTPLSASDVTIMG
jgi:hypothetical protein